MQQLFGCMNSLIQQLSQIECNLHTILLLYNGRFLKLPSRLLGCVENERLSYTDKHTLSRSGSCLLRQSLVVWHVNVSQRVKVSDFMVHSPSEYHELLCKEIVSCCKLCLSLCRLYVYPCA